MSTRKRPPAALRDLCAQPHEDDGTHPREWNRPERKGLGGTSRKDLQLCKQVRLAVESALAAGSDHVLRALVALAAEPAPDARRIRVVLAAPPELFAAHEAELRRRLRASRGYLRCAVSAAVTRKKSPQILLELVPTQPEPSHEE